MGVLSGYATRLTIAQRTLYDRLRSQGIEDAVARQLAVAIEKSQPIKKRKRATSEAYARSYAAEAKKFLDPLYSSHVHSQAMARAGGIVSGQKRRATKDQAIAEAMALAQAEPEAQSGGKIYKALRNSPMVGAGVVLERDRVAKGNKPMGAAFSHARASGDDQSHEARKKRANRYLRSKGHKPIGKSNVQKSISQALRLAKMGPLPGEFAVPEFVENQRRKRKKKDKGRASFSLSGTIVKSISRPWQRLVYSIVYEPDTVDLHGDFMDAATIEKAAHESMRSGIYVNHEHGPERLGAHVVESYVAPCDMNIPSATGEAANIKKGTWVMGLKIEDAATWERILDGTYQGFSLEGSGIAQTLAG